MNNLRRYILREITKDDANKVMRRIFTNPVVMMEWMVDGQYKNPIDDLKQVTFQNLVEGRRVMQEMMPDMQRNFEEAKSIEAQIRKIMTALPETRSELHRALADLRKLRRVAHEMRSSPVAQDFVEKHLTGSPALRAEISEIISAVINAIIRGEARLEPSLALDIMHAFYLPIADLWRSDRHFSHVLRSEGVPHAEKIVPQLTELRERIEAAMEHRAESSRRAAS